MHRENCRESRDLKHVGDVQLVRSVEGGCSTDTQVLLSRLRFVRRFLDAKNSRLGRPFDVHELEDLEQEVLVKMWAQLTAYRGDATIESWVGRIGWLTMLSWLRRRQWCKLLEGHRLDVLLPSAPLNRSRLELEETALYLPRLDGQLVWAHLDEGLSFAMLGRRFGLSTTAARMRYVRALAQLRTQMLRSASPATNFGQGGSTALPPFAPWRD